MCVCVCVCVCACVCVCVCVSVFVLPLINFEMVVSKLLTCSELVTDASKGISIFLQAALGGACCMMLK